jgi:hypothetical protein
MKARYGGPKMTIAKSILEDFLVYFLMQKTRKKTKKP